MNKINKLMRDLGFKSVQQYNFPNIVNVCVIRGDCPCRCIHCPIGITPPLERFSKFGNSSISFQLIKKIIQEMSNFPHSTLRIHGVGEPILWEELSHALNFASLHGVRTWLFTCLITEDASLLSNLAHYCNIVEISINSYTDKNYKKTKKIDAFQHVKSNIEYLANIVKSKNLSTRIIVSRVESEYREYDSNFITYWKNSTLVDDAFIRSYHDYNELLDNKFNRKRQEIIPCLVHWNRFNIDCDGTVALCFNELFKGKHAANSLILGNVESQNISEIWHCEKLNLIRKAQLMKDYSIVNFTDKLPCINCFSCQPFGKEGKPTSEVQIESLKKREDHGQT